MATPSASSARMMAGIAKPNACKPYKRKNRIKHQVAIELGILISFSLGKTLRLREPVMWINPGAADALRASSFWEMNVRDAEW